MGFQKNIPFKNPRHGAPGSIGSSTSIYGIRDDFDFDIENFPFLDSDVRRRASYCVYCSQLIRFARVGNNATDLNARNKCFTAKRLQQGYRYHKLRKTFSKV